MMIFNLVTGLPLLQSWLTNLRLYS